MKNYEKYGNEIRKLKSGIGTEWCDLFAKPKVLKPFGKTCEDVSCGLCNTLTTLWLLEEYEEPKKEEPKKPETDWSKVEVDTPILVRIDEATSWLRRHFAKYEDGKVYAWNGGRTSWNESVATGWEYAKLAESEEE